MIAPGDQFAVGPEPVQRFVQCLPIRLGQLSHQLLSHRCLIEEFRDEDLHQGGVIAQHLKPPANQALAKVMARLKRAGQLAVDQVRDCDRKDPVGDGLDDGIQQAAFGAKTRKNIAFRHPGALGNFMCTGVGVALFSKYFNGAFKNFTLLWRQIAEDLRVIGDSEIRHD